MKVDDAIEAAFDEHKLPRPPLIPGLASVLREVLPLWWSTDPALAGDRGLLTLIDTFSAESPQFATGMWTRGGAGNGVGWVLIRPPLHLALRLSWSNIGGDHGADSEGHGTRFAELGRLLELAAGSPVLARRELVVVEDDFDGSTWGLFDSTANRNDLLAYHWPTSDRAIAEATERLTGG